MIPYWALFSLFAFAALAGGARVPLTGGGAATFPKSQSRDSLLLLGVILVALMIGFRYEVGRPDLEHYQQICPPCRRALFGLAQGALWKRDVESA